MKKVMVMLVAASVASIVAADISVEFVAATDPILNAGETVPGPTTLNNDALAQLVWSADGAGYQTADLLIGDVVSGSANEVILASVLTAGAGFILPTPGIYTDADVGGADINSGYFFARVFDTATPVLGEYFIEFGLQEPTLGEFDSNDPNNQAPYVGNMNDIGLVAVDAQGTQVIPEPATIGLMGIAGLGMFLARRKARR